MIEWIIIGGISVAIYIILYKYEKRIENMQNKIDENFNNIKKHHEKIDKNKNRLDEHYNHIEKLWVSSPLDYKHKKEEQKEN
jgi:archaellum component FlaC